MNMTQLANSTGGALAVLVVLTGVATTIFWMVVGWRAMRAHEDIADVLRGRRQD